MPYINIVEEDVTPLVSFDTIENVVLIFGLDYHFNSTYDPNASGSVETYDYKLYTSVRDFISDIRILSGNKSTSGANIISDRAYITAYDCLINGLPVMYVPLDKYLSQLNKVSGFEDMILYDFLNRPENVPIVPTDPSDFENSYWGGVTDSEGNNITLAIAQELYTLYTSNDNKNAIGAAIKELSSKTLEDGSPVLELSDKVNFPITFITTCGFENHKEDSGKLYPVIAPLLGDRLDLLYLYDLPFDDTPEYISSKIKTEEGLNLSISTGERVNMVYPWGHYNSYSGINAMHMPGSYGYLMAYANSIKNNKPWLAAAGVNRGIIPNIVSLDYKIRESYIHLWQGDMDLRADDDRLSFKINPIVDLGSNYGKVIFGNRTCYDALSESVIAFKNFLNVRILLAFIHKQAFNSSIQHMFEPNDDIVWLSFKQKVNDLLDQMVSGRGLRWYKWYKLRPDKLGQIKARLTIRPIEAVESFEVIISMTDAEIEVKEELEG